MGNALGGAHGHQSYQQRAVVAEYLAHPLKNVEECASIYRGGSLLDYDDHDSQPGARAAAIAPAYPRHLQFHQFEEVFGMLINDPEPHFKYFHHHDTKTVCAPQVFTAIALYMKADLQGKIGFIIRLYADRAGVLSSERKRMLVRDFLLTLQRLFYLADPVPSEILNALERSFWSIEDGKLQTVRELHDVCFTNPRVSSYLHEVQALVQEFATSHEREVHAHRSTVMQSTTRPQQSDGSSEAKNLSRTGTTLGLVVDSFLWSTKVLDYPYYWQQSFTDVKSDVSCLRAVRLIYTAPRQLLLVLEPRRGEASKLQCVGVITPANFVAFFLSLLPPQDNGSIHHEYLRLQLESATRKFAEAHVVDVIRHRQTEGPCKHPFQCTSEDEALFNVALRFACGNAVVGIVRQPFFSHEAFLGVIDVFDLLEWVLEDVESILGAYHAYALSAFDSLFYTPFQIERSMSVIEALVSLEARNLSEALALPSTGERLSISADLFCAMIAKVPENEKPRAEEKQIAAQIQQPLDSAVALLPPRRTLRPSASVRRAIMEMVDHRTKRVYIVDEAGVLIGAVRASDIMLMILTAQHNAEKRQSKMSTME